MKAYGYPKRENVNEDGLMEMSEITIRASLKRLKEIAEFILKSAAEIEDKNGHEHLRDHIENFRSSDPDIIIMVEEEIK
jgi:hypothetical protein